MTDQCAICLHSVGDLPAGTLGRVLRTEKHNDGSLMPDLYVFVADGGTTEHFATFEDLEFVPEHFDPPTALRAQVEKLARERATLERAEDAYSGLKRELDLELKPYQRARSAARDEEKYQYEQVVFYARVAFLATDDKHPDDDVEIKRETTVTYDSLAALKWAMEQGRLDLLALDAKAFEKAAKAGEVPSEVATLKEGWKPFVSSHLAHRLTEPVAEPEIEED